MRFTAGMEEMDDDQFSHGGLLPPRAARHARPSSPVREEAGPRRVEGEREVQLMGSPERPAAVLLRALGPQEAMRIRDELQLLAALEVAGVSAAPAVLEIEDDGYVRETGPTLDRHAGRRAAVFGPPPTAERLALARAREALDALIDALHERGWVLGAPPGGGLGARADGTVMVIDLRGLRREEGLGPRSADRRWVDSVLQDGDRTLRRRVHLAPNSQEAQLDLTGGIAAAQPAQPGEDLAPLTGAEGRPSSLPAPRRVRRRGRGAAASEGEQEPNTPEPAQAVGHAADQQTRTAVLLGVLRRAIASLLSAVREVLEQRRLRRTAVLSGLAVLAGGSALVLGAWWAGERSSPDAEEAPPSAVALEAVDGDAPAPTIDDPWMLAAELAGARHAYVTGASSVPVSAAGSDALAEDDRVRDAYEGVTVRGGGPVVHSAERAEQPTPEGRAVLHVVTSTKEHEIEAADGEVTTVPASDPVRVRLTLEWDGAAWTILGAEVEGPAGGAA